MKIIRNFIILFLLFTSNTFSANNDSFKEWLDNFKIYALDNDISEAVLKNNISNQSLQQEFIDSQKKRINKDRNISIFTSLGIVLFLLALFLVIIVVQFFKSLSNF